MTIPRIITDSTSDFTMEQANALNISMLSLKVNLGGREYVDKVEITSEEFYEKLKKVEKLPTTTLISPQAFQDEYEKYPNQPIVVITISSELSGTYQSACIAKAETGRDDIFVIDSGTATLALGMLVKHAVSMRDSGASAQNIAQAIMGLAQRAVIHAAVDTLHYLVMGGRLSNVQGFMGNVLGLKPILTVTYRSLKATGKVRGMAKASKHLIQLVSEEADRSLPIAFAHTANRDDLNNVLTAIDNACNSDIYTIGSVVGAHVGPGAIAVAYFRK